MSPAAYISFVAFLFLSSTIPGTRSQSFVNHTKSKKELGLKTEKLTHFHFYLHDILGGPNSTDVNVAVPSAATNTTTTPVDPFFGRLVAIDIPLRVSSDIKSKQIGSMQGFVVGASPVTQLTFAMAFSLVFTEDKYNGSTLVVLGRNQATLKTRELPILGGTGVFRFARGYALTSTFLPFSPKVGLTIYEYDVYALHY